MSVVRIKPSTQGELDGACGFYAVVNALKSLEPELDADELFTQVLKAHLVDGDPMRFVNGTLRGTIKNIASRVIKYLDEHYDFYDNKTNEPYRFDVKIPFWHQEKERTRNQVLDILKKSNYKAGTVCIIGYSYVDFENHYAHWSVVKNASDLGLHLFDSDKEKAVISFEEIRVDSIQQSNVARPYNLFSEDIFVISRVAL